jgi:hypothetical protein
MATMKLDELVAQLGKVFGDRLRSVVLYGSAAGAGEHIPKRSDYNVLVVVDELTMDQLRASAAVARAWGEAGHPPPLTLTTDEWRASGDIFPMEYADILDRHRILHGTAPFDGIAVDRRDLRLQVEHEAMGRLLQLRRGVLAAGRDDKRQLELLASSLSAMMVVFRAVERLNGATPAADNETLSRDVARRAAFDAEPFVRVVHHVRGTGAIPAAESTAVLEGYLRGAERLARYLDRYTDAGAVGA